MNNQIVFSNRSVKPAIKEINRKVYADLISVPKENTIALFSLIILQGFLPNLFKSCII